jgi:hypothetical protein
MDLVNSYVSFLWVFHELLDAFVGSLIVRQPFDLPFGNPLALLRDEMAAFWFVNPFELTHEYEWHLCPECFLEESFCCFILSESDEVVVIAVELLPALVRVNPDPIFEHVIIEVTSTRLGIKRIGTDTDRSDRQRVCTCSGSLAVGAN